MDAFTWGSEIYRILNKWLIDRCGSDSFPATTTSREETEIATKRGESGSRMPELPEVEAARRAIEEHCTGKKIAACSVADDLKVIEGVSRSDLEAALFGKTILAALRKGKNLWLRLDSPPFPTFQFGRYSLSHLS